MSYEKEIRKHRRIAILRFLKDSPGYTSNASVLADITLSLGVPSTYDQIVTEAAWLQEQGFARYDSQADYPVITATARGVEIASGIATHPEIQRPRPRA